MNRRTIIKNTSLGILGLAHWGLPEINLFRASRYKDLPEYYPNIDPEIISSVVGKSHSDLEAVKKLVDARPELARSVWEWRYGDFESAIGAASHVGRRDIALYLIAMGARPTIFTFAMLGAYHVIKSMVDFYPGIQSTMGPHGISLLDHAYAGERMKKNMSEDEIIDLEKTIDYLRSLGNASGQAFLDISPEDQKKYLGTYKYGPGPEEGFNIQLNMRKQLSLGPINGFGGGLYRIEDHKFIYNGAPSVVVSFSVDEDKVISLAVREPQLTVEAIKV